MFETWLIAWLIGVAAVAGLIAMSWSVATYRELRRAGAPGAGRILTRLWFSPVAWLLRLGDRADAKPGAPAWVWWDVRSLARPMELYLATGEPLQVTDVRFMPSNHHSYTWGTPTGVLEPVNSATWQRAPGERPNARVCVLEVSTD